MAGAEPEAWVIAEAKEAVGDQVPVLMNTGARAENIGRFLQVADGVIVGSGLKVDGQTWNSVDPARVAAFMEAVRAPRGRELVPPRKVFRASLCVAQVPQNLGGDRRSCTAVRVDRDVGDRGIEGIALGDGVPDPRFPTGIEPWPVLSAHRPPRDCRRRGAQPDHDPSVPQLAPVRIVQDRPSGGAHDARRGSLQAHGQCLRLGCPQLGLPARSEDLARRGVEQAEDELVVIV